MAVTTPDPHAAGSTRHSQWWVIQQFSSGRGSVPLYSVVMATSKPTNAVQGPFSSQNAANKTANQMNGGGINLPSIPNPLGWLSSLGGMIGSGIESGFISAIKDVWTVIIGPLEVLIGGIIIVFTLAMYFKGEILGLASLAAMAAA